MDEPEAKTSKQAEVTVLEDDLIVINKIKYRLLEDHDNGFNREKIEERYNSVLDKYDYIVGDWGYDQLRFKGFYMDKRIESNIDNKISHLQDYLLEYCNFGCAYFILEREEKLPLTKPKHHRRTHSNRNQHSESNNHRSNRNNRHKPYHKGAQGKSSEDKPHIRRRKPENAKATSHKRRQQNHKSTSNSGSRSFKIRKIDK